MRIQKVFGVMFGEDQMSGQDVSSFQERIDLIFSNKLDAVSICCARNRTQLRVVFY
jgi:hypothetical protein